MRIGSIISGAVGAARTTAQEATQTWKSFLNQQIGAMQGEDGLAKHLGEQRVATIEQKVTSAMETFVRSNPGARLEDIENKAGEVFKKAQGDALFSKMAFDNFLAQIEKRMREIREELAA